MYMARLRYVRIKTCAGVRLLKQRSQQGDSCWFGAGLRYHLHPSPLRRDLDVEAPTAVGVGGTKVLGRASG